MLKLRRSDERGKIDFGWVQARYTFSFGKYFSLNHNGIGPIVAINQDTISPGTGFSTHPHRDMEILSYIIEGALEHKDSTGHHAIINAGSIQFISAGKGISHSEYNPSKEFPTKMLQIWIKPSILNLEPRYAESTFTQRQELNKPCLLVSKDGRDESIKINQSISIFTTKLEKAKRIKYDFEKNNFGWLQLIKGNLKVNHFLMFPGDGISISDIESLSIIGLEDSEFLLFDINAS